MLIFGIWPAPASFALILFTLIASIMFLNFWSKPEPERSAQRNAFLGNIAIIGAPPLAVTKSATCLIDC
jgi:uncharacterized membrane protein YphA (DoxX/SURF4 family)